MLKGVLILLIIFYSEIKIAFAEDKPRSFFGYVWLEKWEEYNPAKDSLPAIGSIVDKDVIGSTYMYQSTSAIDKMMNFREKQDISCNEKAGIGKRGEQFYSGVQSLDLFFHPVKKGCGFPAVKLRKGFDYENFMPYTKRLKILSYYSSNGVHLFALVEYGGEKYHPFNQ